MSDKKKIQKELFKQCPECGGKLYVVEDIVFNKGVQYSTSIIECFNCGFSVLYKKKKNNPPEFL